MLNDRNLQNLSRQLDEITSFLAGGEEQICTLKPGISGWSAAEQLDHTLKVDSSILRRVTDSQELETLPKGINLLGRVILAIGWIPRGKAPSPQALRGERTDCAALRATVAAVRGQVESITQDQVARSAALVPHPRFGGLTTPEALRFAVVHTEHHLKIVREILAS